MKHIEINCTIQKAYPENCLERNTQSCRNAGVGIGFGSFSDFIRKFRFFTNRINNWDYIISLYMINNSPKSIRGFRAVYISQGMSVKQYKESEPKQLELLEEQLVSSNDGVFSYHYISTKRIRRKSPTTILLNRKNPCKISKKVFLENLNGIGMKIVKTLTLVP
ncbi:hypothetical protein MHZ95_18100 [Sporosarcina sp. ACRSM]|uniref:hypothetical protein n=1 Tax=Sporosarcina sp. ACRSM TaxID=2918216 RepID=UPI001EF74CC1|nr:hypothetical protein [Sporosarcina sp. ACRSM]MCG7337174.1 hypothetical protein [Sporosarcina sp. ACRSM]